MLRVLAALRSVRMGRRGVEIVQEIELTFNKGNVWPINDELFFGNKILVS